MAFLDTAGLERLWTQICAKLGTKVDAVEGKQLSTNDYTTAEKEKLAGLSDTKVTTNTVSPTSETSYYPTMSVNSTTGANGTLVKHAAFRSALMHGTADTVGMSKLVLGNSTKAGVAGNMAAILTLYSDGAGAGLLKQATTDSWPTHYLPTTSGTLLNSQSTASKAKADENGYELDRVYNAKIPIGTSIAANSDLNTVDFLKVGNYYCSTDVTVKTFSNCPTPRAFMMQVYNPLSATIDDESTGTWRYRIRKILTYTGEEYIQYVNSGSTAGTFTYDAWKHIAKSGDAISMYGVTTSGTGDAYTATVDGITYLGAGARFIMVPHTVSTSATATLNVNGLGAKTLRRALSSGGVATVASESAGWLVANIPVEVMYNGTYWLVMDMVRPNMADAYGTLPVSKGGTGATAAGTTLLSNIGITSGTGEPPSSGTAGTIYIQYSK